MPSIFYENKNSGSVQSAFFLSREKSIKPIKRAFHLLQIEKMMSYGMDQSQFFCDFRSTTCVSRKECESQLQCTTNNAMMVQSKAPQTITSCEKIKCRSSELIYVMYYTQVNCSPMLQYRSSQRGQSIELLIDYFTALIYDLKYSNLFQFIYSFRRQMTRTDSFFFSLSILFKTVLLCQKTKAGNRPELLQRMVSLGHGHIRCSKASRKKNLLSLFCACSSLSLLSHFIL